LDLARQLVADYGYLAVFVGTFLEGETVLLAAAFAASQGLLAAPMVAGVGALGAYTGHAAFFLAGRAKGSGWLLDHPRLGPHARKADAVINRYGWSSVFILQYLYGARIAGALLFGVSTFTLPRFLALQVVNCATWAVLVTAAGYLLGATLEVIAGRLSWVSAGVVVAVLAGALGLALWRRKRRRPRGASP
jgi:membrane protein DedA with SNARE-associated domain